MTTPSEMIETSNRNYAETGNAKKKVTRDDMHETAIWCDKKLKRRGKRQTKTVTHCAPWYRISDVEQ